MYGHIGWDERATRFRAASRWQLWLHALIRMVSVGFEIVAAWGARSAQRRHLAAMSDHMLRDIGVDRATARGESAKPFWRT